MIDILIYSIHFFEFIAAVLATFYFKKYRHTTESIFFYFLWFTFLVEVVGFVVWDVFKKPNIWVYIIYVFISFLVYFYWYYTIFKNKLSKKIIAVAALIFIILGLVNMSTQSWLFYHTSTFVFGAIITVMASLFYFSEVLNSDEVLKIKNSLRFWIATGLLLFNVGMVPFMLFSKDLNVLPALRNIILVSLNLILYTCYSLGFIWAKPVRKQSL